MDHEDYVKYQELENKTYKRRTDDISHPDETEDDIDETETDI
jgi:hypothetical protein